MAKGKKYTPCYRFLQQELFCDFVFHFKLMPTENDFFPFAFLFCYLELYISFCIYLLLKISLSGVILNGRQTSFFAAVAFFSEMDNLYDLTEIRDRLFFTSQYDTFGVKIDPFSSLLKAVLQPSCIFKRFCIMYICICINYLCTFFVLSYFLVADIF